MRSQVLQNADNLLAAGGRPEFFLNGLWSCEQGGTRLYVGIYGRATSSELNSGRLRFFGLTASQYFEL